MIQINKILVTENNRAEARDGAGNINLQAVGETTAIIVAFRWFLEEPRRYVDSIRRGT